MTDPRTSIRFAAIDMCGQAKCHQLDPADAMNLMARADQLLDSDDRLFRAISGFMTQYELVKFDPDQVAEEAEKLHAYLLSEMQPDPIDAARSDVHG
jgi:hypothetical protein